MFETTRECTLTKDLVCSIAMISESATPMKTMKWILSAIVRSKSTQDFHSLTLVIYNTSTISAYVRVQVGPAQAGFFGSMKISLTY